MITTETIMAIAEGSFQGENVSIQDIVDYITKSDVFFGICEEPEDLNALRKSYEY